MKENRNGWRVGAGGRLIAAVPRTSQASASALGEAQAKAAFGPTDSLTRARPARQGSGRAAVHDGATISHAWGEKDLAF